ncbi:MAG: hypothetical protein KAX05_15575 [Bacteroidales bacterium]|nr:hypothetical protein [Bacteroidales bacterium]
MEKQLKKPKLQIYKIPQNEILTNFPLKSNEEEEQEEHLIPPGNIPFEQPEQQPAFERQYADDPPGIDPLYPAGTIEDKEGTHSDADKTETQQPLLPPDVELEKKEGVE